MPDYLPLLAETHDKIHIPLEWVAIVAATLVGEIVRQSKGKARVQAKYEKLLIRLAKQVEAVDDGEG